MNSRIAGAIGLNTQPVALLWTDEKPAQAAEFKPGAWACVMWLAAGAAKGRTGVCSRDIFGCFGGGVGMGFGDHYANFPGGKACSRHFLSPGNDGWPTGREAAEQVKLFMNKATHAHFRHGEGYFQSPDLVRRFIDSLPMADIPATSVVFKPLSAVAPEAHFQSVIFASIRISCRPWWCWPTMVAGTTRMSSFPLPPVARPSVSIPTAKPSRSAPVPAKIVPQLAENP